VIRQAKRKAYLLLEFNFIGIEESQSNRRREALARTGKKKLRKVTSVAKRRGSSDGNFLSKVQL
jgi:hypothetical protein